MTANQSPRQSIEDAPPSARRVDPTETALARPQQANVEVALSRAAQEVQSAMIIAKRFPRDETTAMTKIITACKRRGLAEQAVYSYPRGTETVDGPSIRLAEAIAQAWGNLDFGIIELDQNPGASNVMAYCWDLETNTRQTKIFAVPHRRHTKTRDYALTDPRDIYEMVANQGARRLRACILGVIPGDVIDAALAQVDQTLKSGGDGPVIDRVRKMVSAFQEIAVTQAMIEGRLRHKIEATSETELVSLRKIYKSIQDGMAGREQFFEVGEAPDPAANRTSELAERLDRDRQNKAADAENALGGPALDATPPGTPAPAPTSSPVGTPALDTPTGADPAGGAATPAPTPLAGKATNATGALNWLQAAMPQAKPAKVRSEFKRLVAKVFPGIPEAEISGSDWAKFCGDETAKMIVQ